jgi:hypothetical protein
MDDDMKRILLVIILSLISIPLFAQWERSGDTVRPFRPNDWLRAPKIKTGTIYSPSNQTVVITAPLKVDSLLTINGSGIVSTYSPPAPTNLTCTPHYNPLFITPYVATGLQHNVKVYSYRTIDGIRYYSNDYLTLPDNFQDNGSTQDYYIAWAWTQVSDVDGYRVLKYDSYTPKNYDYYRDGTDASLFDQAILGWFSSGSTVTPNTFSETANQRIVYDANNYANTHVDGSGTYFLNPTNSGQILNNLFSFSPAGDFTAPNKIISDTSTARIINGMQNLTGYGNTNTGTYSSVMGLTNSNTGSYSTISGIGNKNATARSSIAGDYDTSYVTNGFGNVHIMGNNITVGRTNPAGTYGVWAWGARLRSENLGNWLIGAYDGNPPYPIIPFEGSVVFVNEGIHHWLNNPQGLYKTTASMQVSSPNTRDTMRIGIVTQQRGGADAAGYMSYNIERNLTTSMTGTKIGWSDYRWLMSMNYDGFDDIHFNLNANDATKRGWGGFSIDNGKFGVLHGNAFTDTSAYDNVIYGTTNFYGNITGVNIGTMSAADSLHYFANRDTNTTKNPITLSYAIANYSPIAGSSSITTLGTITTGVWNAGAITSSGSLTLSYPVTNPYNAIRFRDVSAPTWGWDFAIDGVSTLDYTINSVSAGTPTQLFKLAFGTGNATFAGTVQATNIITTTPPTDSTGLARGTVWLKTSDGTLHWKY